MSLYLRTSAVLLAFLLNTSYGSELRPLAKLLLTLNPASAFRTVLVTGGNKGIGLQLCKKIIQTEPDAYVLLGSRSVARGEKAVQEVLAAEPSAAGRIDLLELDVTDDASIAAAAESVKAKFPEETHPLYAICNNAGVGFEQGFKKTLAANLYGTKRVSEIFLPLIDPAEGRICNIGSGSAPFYVSGCNKEGKRVLTSRETTWEDLEAFLKKMTAGTDYDDSAYGLSKAALNTWTMIFAKANPNLRINSASPGYVLTDITAGRGARNKPEDSNCHVAPLFLLFGDVPQPEVNKGRYYGSDAQRSPLDRYRDPGSPPYVGD